ncbi:MAG: hypothetical protein RL616_1960 [Verrucomicrobiota bacterium]
MMTFPKLAAVTCAILLPILVRATPAVTISEDETSYTLANGIITAHISKHSGDLLSLEYKKLELLDTESGRQEGYWSHNAARAAEIIPHITIDPKANDGERRGDAGKVTPPASA